MLWLGIDLLLSSSVSNKHRAKTADVMIDGVLYEIKSPKTDKLSAVECNLKRATKQSGSIIIDSRRMSKLHDATIQKFLAQKLKQQKTIKKILFINRKHQVIDISGILDSMKLLKPSTEQYVPAARLLFCLPMRKLDLRDYSIYRFQILIR